MKDYIKNFYSIKENKEEITIPVLNELSNEFLDKIKEKLKSKHYYLNLTSNPDHRRQYKRDMRFLSKVDNYSPTWIKQKAEEFKKTHAEKLKNNKLSKALS